MSEASKVENLSLETRKRRSKSATGRVFSDETKRKLSKSLKEAYKSGRARAPKRNDENNPFYGKHHTKETRQKMSQSQSGRSHTDETKQKMSEMRLEDFKTGKRKVHDHAGCGINSFRPDLNQRFRSNWEANVARILNYQGISWQFEPQRFDLGYTTYLPDFYLPDEDRWIEVKGYMREDDEIKIHLFREMGYNLMVIDLSIYKKLTKEFKHLIPKWES